MSRLPRPFVPWEVRCQVAWRQLQENNMEFQPAGRLSDLSLGSALLDNTKMTLHSHLGRAKALQLVTEDDQTSK